MIMFNPLLIVCCITSFAFMVSSCSHENIGKYADNVYNVADNDKRVYIGDYIKSLDITPLDTSVFLYDVKDFTTCGNLLFVSDGECIYKFDTKSGLVLARYNKRGHGHNEYVRMIGFDVDSVNKTIFVLAEPPKIIVLSFDFETLKEIDLHEFYHSIAFFQGNIYLYSYFSQTLNVLRDGKMVEIVDLPITPAWFSSLSLKTFYKSKDELMFFPQPYSSVYSVKGDSIKQIIHFSYPEEEHKMDRVYGHRIIRGTDDILANSLPVIRSVAQHDELMIVTYTYGIKCRVCLLDLASKQIINDGYISFYQFPSTTCDGSFANLEMMFHNSFQPSLDSLKAEVNYTLPEDKNNEQLALVKYYFRPDLIAK